MQIMTIGVSVVPTRQHFHDEILVYNKPTVLDNQGVVSSCFGIAA